MRTLIRGIAVASAGFLALSCSNLPIDPSLVAQNLNHLGHGGGGGCGGGGTPAPEKPTVSGCWNVDQNNGNTGMFNLAQTGTNVTGNADWYTHPDGAIAGTFVDSTLDFTITYPGGLIGYYVGTLSRDGLSLVNGSTHSNNGAFAQWTAVKVACTQSSKVDTIVASQDACVRGDLDARMNDNYGGDNVIIVGGHRENSQAAYGTSDGIRSLIQFAVPAGVTITRATLQVGIASFYSFSPPQIYKVSAHRIVSSGNRTPWIEGNGNELEGYPECNPLYNVDDASGVAWVGADDGGDANNVTQPDYDPAVLDQVVLDERVSTSDDVVSWDVTTLVQQWSGGQAPNFGIMLRDVSDYDGTFRHVFFWSKDICPGAHIAPRLIIEYQ